MPLEQPSVNRAAYSVSQFCKLHNISRSLFYSLAEHERPVVMQVGSKRLISAEAAEAWRRKMEQQRD
jgi:hypothetical protein